jgi:hypothetical protein
MCFHYLLLLVQVATICFILKSLKSNSRQFGLRVRVVEGDVRSTTSGGRCLRKRRSFRPTEKQKYYFVFV